MSKTGECLSFEKFMLLHKNELSSKEREEVLRHIADCGECAIGYSIFKSLLDAEKNKSEDLQNGVNSEAEAQINDVRNKTMLTSRRTLSYAAVIVLLISVSFFSGFSYASFSHTRIIPFSDDRKFETTNRYWSKLDESVNLKNMSTQAKSVLGSRDPSRILSVKEILALKDVFDKNVNEIVSQSEKDTDTILSIETLDVIAMTPLDIKAYATFLRMELQSKEDWIKLNKSDFISIAGGYFGSLPPEVWERYPVNDESLRTLSWIAGLPEDRKEKILMLSPEQATEERNKEQQSIVPN